MAFNPVEYLVQKIRTYDSSIDVSPGSAIRDLLINPLSSMLSSFNEKHQIFENRLSLNDLDSLSETALDDIAANFLVSRISGAKAGGFVKLFFKDPQTITIAKNTEFRSTGGLRFYTTKQHTVTSSQMLANSDRYPLYHTGNIQVRAELEGLSYEIGPQEITSVLNLGTAYDAVGNDNAFTGGADKDTNEKLFEKIVTSVNNGSLASSAGLSTTLKNNFSSIVRLLVIGAGDDLMLRDIAQDSTRPDVVSYAETDFQGKIAGQNSTPYVENQAFYGLFVDEDLTNSGFLITEMPEPTVFTREYSQEEYTQLFKSDAFITAITPSKVLVYETFDASGYDSSWVTSDERMGWGVLAYSGEVLSKNGVIYLGNDLDRPGRFFTYADLIQISGFLDQIETLA